MCLHFLSMLCHNASRWKRMSFPLHFVVDHLYASNSESMSMLESTDDADKRRSLSMNDSASNRMEILIIIYHHAQKGFTWQIKCNHNNVHGHMTDEAWFSYHSKICWISSLFLISNKMHLKIVHSKVFWGRFIKTGIRCCAQKTKIKSAETEFTKLHTDGFIYSKRFFLVLWTPREIYFVCILMTLVSIYRVHKSCYHDSSVL